MATGKKYYWLKLEKDFFKRHDIKIVEAMDNGKDYILFYLKLLCESTSHEGNLRFSETVPYNAKMLSVVTGTNVDVVEKAIKIFTELGMMSTLDDGTIYMNELNKMLGFETDWAKKQREYRNNKIGGGDIVPNMSLSCPPNVRQEKEIELDIEIDKEREIYKEKENTKIFKKPTIEEIKAYCERRNNKIDPNAFYDFYESKGWMVGKNKMKDWEACVRTWEKSNKGSNKTTKDIPDWYEDYDKRLKEASSKEQSTEDSKDAYEYAKSLFDNITEK